MPTGYSETPLDKKLGFKPGQCYLLCNEPSHYFDLFDDFPADVTRLKNIENGTADFIHLFCTTEKELSEMVNIYKPALKQTGMLWVSWPKGGSNIKSDLKREPIREFLLSIGLVDVKVASIDENWSGLKFVHRVKDRN